MKMFLDGRIMLPSDLQDLYSIYQQEIHASTYETSVNAPSATSRISSKLPPISRGAFTYENSSSDGRMFSRYAVTSFRAIFEGFHSI